MEQYWNAALSFQQYMNTAEERMMRPKTEDDRIKRGYYELGLRRMNRVLDAYKPDENHTAMLKAKNFSGRILIISEPWCGDASTTVPVLNAFFENAGVQVRVFLRDDDQSLINSFLTNGSQSIPKVLILNDDFSVKNVWGPRPAFGNELLEKFRQDPHAYPRETFYSDLQVYYAKNRGRDVIEEIINLL